MFVRAREADAVLRHACSQMREELEAGAKRVAADRIVAEITAIIDRADAEAARFEAIDDPAARSRAALRRELVRRLSEVRARILDVRRELDAILNAGDRDTSERR